MSSAVCVNAVEYPLFASYVLEGRTVRLAIDDNKYSVIEIASANR